MKINPFFILISFLIILLQKLIFSDPVITLSNEYPVVVFIVPVIILALPIEIERPITMIVAFILGLSTDVLSDTLGITSFSLVLMAYIRHGIINLLQPRKGYQVGMSWFQNGLPWVVSYVVINLLIYSLGFFIIDAFTFVYLKKILINTLLGTLISTPFCVLLLSIMKYR